MVLISSCSNVRMDTSDCEFQTQAIREVGSDTTGNYEDYLMKGATVRFYSMNTPSDLRNWDGFGTDGGLPNELLTKIFVRCELGDYDFPSTLIDDLGDPNIRGPLEYDHVRIRKTGSFLRICMSNSDGAGSYKVFFLVDLRHGRVRRFVQDYTEDQFTRTHDWIPLNNQAKKTLVATGDNVSG